MVSVVKGENCRGELKWSLVFPERSVVFTRKCSGGSAERKAPGLAALAGNYFSQPVTEQEKKRVSH